MERSMSVLSDVVSCIKLARGLGHRPLVNKILQSCIETLDGLPQPPLPRLPPSELLPDATVLATLNELSGGSEPPAELLPPSPKSDEVSSTSSRGQSRYNLFISSMTPHLRRLYPTYPQKVVFTEAARLWGLHKHLATQEEVVASAHADAVRQAAVVNPPPLTISIPIGLDKEEDLTPS